MKLFEVEQPITPAQLNALEKALDALFKSLGIDVEFTRHFIDRVNDERNQQQITMPELVNMFKKEYKRWGKPIAQMGPDSEAVMKDLESDINIPFVLKWDRDNQELDLVAKSVMRKKNFKTSNKEFPVESEEVEESFSDQVTDFGMFSRGGNAQVQNIIHYTLDDFEDKVEDATNSERDTLRMDALKTLFKELEDLAEDPKHEEATDTEVRERAAQYLDKGIIRIMNRLDNVNIESSDIPTQKGRDAKHDVLTSKARNTVLKQIKKSANKQRRADSKKAIEEDETPTPIRRISDEEKLAMFNELKAGDTVYLWYDSAFKRGEKYKPFKMGRRTKSEKYNLSKFSMQQISAEGIPAGVKFFLYNRGGKISLAMGDMAATLVDMQTSVTYPKADTSEGLSEDFHFFIEYKGKEIKQSDPLTVLDKLAARRDNMPFPIRFYDGEIAKVTPKMAKRFIDAYYDRMDNDQRELVDRYIKTKNGFKTLISKLQIKD